MKKLLLIVLQTSPRRKPGSRKLTWIPAFAGMTVFVFSLQAYAAGPGTTTGELLKIPVSARAIGMGEAYTAATDDSAALAWNPAGLSFMKQKEAAFMHTSLIEDIHYEHLAFAAPGENLAAGASLSYLGYGSFSGYDAGNQPIGEQTANAYTITGGASLFVIHRFSIGVAGTFLRENLAGDKANTFAGNAGVLYGLASRPVSTDFRLGASVLNVGSGLKFSSERSPLPRKIKVGAAALHVHDWPVNFTTDITFPNDNDTYASFGSEYWLKELVAFRAGFTGTNEEGNGLRLGFGAKVSGMLFDYAYAGFGDLGVTHRFELSMRWGDKKSMQREKRSVLKEAKRPETKGDYADQIVSMNELMQKNPENDALIKEMIIAHQKMLHEELQGAIAEDEIEPTETILPSPEEYALQIQIPADE